MSKLLIIDTHALFHRSRSALSRAMGEGGMTTSYGVSVTGTYGFLSSLFSTLEKGNYDCVVPCYDAGGNFRKSLDGAYKANRERSSDSHYEDLATLIQSLTQVGLNPVGKEGFEADDLIAEIARNSGSFSEKHIFTCDRDLLQLVDNSTKVLLFNSAKKVDLIDSEGVVKVFGVLPKEVPLFKALSGDSSDNVSGIPGIGPKTAVKVIEASRSSDKSGLSQADWIAIHPKVIQNSQKFFENLKLVDLQTANPKLSEVTWYASSAPRKEEVRALFEALEFKSFLKEKRFNSILKALKVE